MNMHSLLRRWKGITMDHKAQRSTGTVGRMLLLDTPGAKYDTKATACSLLIPKCQRYLVCPCSPTRSFTHVI